MNHLASLQEIHSISSEIHSRRARLREAIRNADDTLLDVIADSLLKASSTPVPAVAKTEGAPGPKPKKKVKAKKEKGSVRVHELGTESVRDLILKVMDKTPIGPSDIVERFKDKGFRINSDNPKVYISWVLTDNCTGKTSPFVRVQRGKYLARGRGTKDAKRKLIVGELPPFMTQDWVQKVFGILNNGNDIFTTAEVALSTGMNGQKFANLFAKLREMHILKKAGDSKWKLVNRATLQGLMTINSVKKANGHRDSRPPTEVQDATAN